MTLAVLGIERLPLAIAIAVLALACHLAGWFLFPPDQALVLEESWFLDQLYANSAISIMAIIFLIVFYGFRLAYLAEQRIDALLHKMMPAEIVQRLKENPQETIADPYEDATILFADLKGFTPLFGARPRPHSQAARRALLRLRSRGGCPRHDPDQDHRRCLYGGGGPPGAAPRSCRGDDPLCLRAARGGKQVGRRHGLDLSMRVGIASGPVMAGVIGEAKVTYDVWATLPNLAARLESYGEPGRIHVSAATRAALEGSHAFTPPIIVDLKGIGEVECSFLLFEPRRSAVVIRQIDSTRSIIRLPTA